MNWAKTGNITNNRLNRDQVNRTSTGLNGNRETGADLILAENRISKAEIFPISFPIFLAEIFRAAVQSSVLPKGMIIRPEWKYPWKKHTPVPKGNWQLINRFSK